MPREYRHLDKTMDADHLPTPDPASPCGHPECEHDARATWTHPPAGPYLHGSHPHVPTRCTCGDPIEEATR